MKYFILLATSLVFLVLSACGDESCNDTGTPPVQDTVGQVGDAVSEVSSDALMSDDSSDVSADATSGDSASEEDVQEEPADVSAAEDSASSSD